jgi:hypothetical protein
MSRKVLIFLFILFASAMLAIGRLYDSRLEIYGVNLTILLSSFYCIFLIALFLTKKSIKISALKVLQYLFYFSLIVSNLVLWMFYDVQEYGVIKFINLLLITIPISIIISEYFKIKDRNVFIYILLSISVFLLLIAIFNFSSLSFSRSGVLGGGPIVLSRWLCFGALICSFHPKINNFKFLYVAVFIVISLFTGSRGPFFSLLLVMFIYLLINFRRIFLKVLFVLSLLVSIIFISGLYNKLAEYKTVSRIFMNFNMDGMNKSTGRTILYKTSINEFISYPLGVGSGNFAVYSDKRMYLQNKQLFYPHNIYLEIFTEFGLFSGLLFFIYIFYSTIKSYKLNIKDRNNDYGNLLFYTFVFLVMNSLVSGDLNDARLLLVFIPLMCIENN